MKEHTNYPLKVSEETTFLKLPDYPTEEQVIASWREGKASAMVDNNLYTDGKKLISYGVVIGTTLTVGEEEKKAIWDLSGVYSSLHRARGLHITTASKNCDFYLLLPIGCAI